MDAVELIGRGFWMAFQMAWEVWWALRGLTRQYTVPALRIAPSLETFPPRGSPFCDPGKMRPGVDVG